MTIMKIKKNLRNPSSSSITGSSTVVKRQNKLEQVLSFLQLGFINSKPTIAILRLEGVIGKGGGMKPGLSMAGVNKLIEKAFEFSQLEAICLVVNSPGGSPVQSELITNRIIQLAKKHEVPVYSFVEDVAASGGYWLATAGEKIFASRSSVIGSIGVITSGFGFQEAIHKMGIERRVYTQGKNKSVLDPFQAVKESDIHIIHSLQRNIHEHFIESVKKRRGSRLTQSDDILFTGEFWTGETALDYGLIDGLDNVYSFIEKHYGDNIKIEYIEGQQSWIKKKLGMVNISEQFASDLSENIISKAEEKLISSKFEMK